MWFPRSSLSKATVHKQYARAGNTATYHCCTRTHSSSYNYGHIGNLYAQIIRGRKCKYVRVICGHKSKTIITYKKASLGSGPEGQWERKKPPNWAGLSSGPQPRCVERGLAQYDGKEASTVTQTTRYVLIRGSHT